MVQTNEFYDSQLDKMTISEVRRLAVMYLKHLERNRNEGRKHYNPEKKREYHYRKKAEKEVSVQSKGLDQLLSPSLADLGCTSLTDSISSSSD